MLFTENAANSSLQARLRQDCLGTGIEAQMLVSRRGPVTFPA
jgi:hypothetical protein